LAKSLELPELRFGRQVAKLRRCASKRAVKTYLTIWISIVALVIGVAIGWFASARIHREISEKDMQSNAYLALAQRYRALRTLQDGDTNQTVQTLETLMNGDILLFGSILRETPADRRSPEDLRLLTRVRDYRTAHPWKAAGYPMIDQEVADVFALVGTNQSR
jgi:hypothetical protein